MSRLSLPLFTRQLHSKFSSVLFVNEVRFDLPLLMLAMDEKQAPVEGNLCCLFGRKGLRTLKIAFSFCFSVRGHVPLDSCHTAMSS
jgi:hypothetical protein